MGVVARLATIDDEPLARIMSAQYRSLLTVVVVEDMACRERLVRLLVQHKLPTPDVMALSQTLPYRWALCGVTCCAALHCAALRCAGARSGAPRLS